MRLLPHEHDYDLQFPDMFPELDSSGVRWRFTCKCGKTVFTQEAALEDMWWTAINRKVALVLWGVIIGFVGFLIVYWATWK